MSVEVKTPTRTQYEHREFPCGEGSPASKPKPSPTISSKEKGSEHPSLSNNSTHGSVASSAAQQRPYNRQHSQGARKRLGSQKEWQSRHTSKKSRLGGKQHAPGQFPLPTKFLLGGNIRDPLNLNSLCDDEEVNKALNQDTPVSSPIPTPAHRKEQVEVIIPPNITDPLNLNEQNDGEMKSNSAKKKKRNHHVKNKKNKTDEGRKKEEDKSSSSSVATTPLTIDTSEEMITAMRKVNDEIVSPVIPQHSRQHSRKPSASATVTRSILTSETMPSEKQQTDPLSSSGGSGKIHKSKPKKEDGKQGTHFHKKNPKFIHGNYNRYYGYRNPNMEEDFRLKVFIKEWFEGKDVLDIGCNVGLVTLQIAKEFEPRRIVGLDIDSKLIAAARRNIKNFILEEELDASRCYGPLTAPPLPEEEALRFPQNIMFKQGNYVLENDALLDLQREEYDVILGLSLTKWMHLNSGDDGLKRAFKRMFRQLRPGGILILEPQSWASYKKKKKLTEEIYQAFCSIQFRPDQFTEYLLSKEVGFSKCELIAVPFNKSKGFRRPLQMFTKPLPPTSSRQVSAVSTPTQLSAVSSPAHQMSAVSTPTRLSAVSSPAHQMLAVSTSTSSQPRGSPPAADVGTGVPSAAASSSQ
ncbi:7SK snRNA methylphosphate capping enzyme isoform X2 [Lingula anatina]|uniref:RNA methyltransferase n=1 Tax=Lingula anatina TaxID=7574 RepID=A0A1S3JX46_LINAN|nr:7SK snRNA methylphosphate capping enzyme isoform X2 [Lingula anatina]|eukprot:XP_013414626.1 7SK snRNA methylphosphate capping enzyme isoform X2 [Lingula anatina]